MSDRPNIDQILRVRRKVTRLEQVLRTLPEEKRRAAEARLRAMTPHERDELRHRVNANMEGEP